jgi:heme-degrading monooxygenase HmoA
MEIKRIVSMTFQKERIEDFLKMFNERKLRIRNFPGCLHLELWQGKKERNAFFTYSIWESEEALNHYRFSEFFKETWSLTKSWFTEKPAAWTIEMFDTV